MGNMKLFRVRGGVHPEERKITAHKGIARMTPASTLYLPLQQHVGTPATPLVAPGERVRKGQLIAAPSASVSAPVHAPTSGTVTAIHPHKAPHPSGLTQATLVLEPDGLEEWDDLPPPLDPLAAGPKAVGSRVRECGVVGLGGAGFPSAVKLTLRDTYDLDTLVINGAECEPYLTTDDRLMQEHTEEILDGVHIMRYALEVQMALVAIETNKPRALAAMRKAAEAYTDIRIIGIPSRYPMGSERHLVHTITGRETPARGLTAHVGVVVHNVATARAVHRAVRHGEPLISRVITVSGGAVADPGNLEVPLGTLVQDVFTARGGLKEEPARLVAGGPMMGQPLPGTDVPTVKGINGLLALTAEETRRRPAQSCIRCGRCVTACPCGLVPVEMAGLIRKEKLAAAARIGVQDCISCGSCSFICPSHIPLAQYFNYAKGRLKALQNERQRNDLLKEVAERRAERIAKQEAEKKARLLAQKEKARAAKAAREAAAETPAAAPSEPSSDQQEPKAEASS